MDLVAGVDSSTQSCTVELRRRDDGALVGTASAPHPRTAPPVSRQDPRAWWAAFRAAFSGALRDADADARQVVALAVGAQCHGLVLLGRDGEPLATAPLWNDTTAGPTAARIAHEYGLERWMQDVGMAPSSALTIMKLAHVATTDPGLLERVAHVLVPHDYLTYRLTGAAVTDRSDAAGTGYLDVHRGEWRPELLDRFVSSEVGWEDVLPTVLGPDTPAGTVRPHVAAELGLGPGVVVGPGGGDQHLAAVGLGLAEGDLGVSLGTSGVVLSPRRTSVVDPLGTVDSVCDATGGYLPLACTLNAAKVTDTFARLLDVDHATLERLALAAPVRAQRPTLVAYLDGERTPRRPGATGVLGGITGETTREDVALAAYEGVVAGLVGAARALERAGVDTSGEVVVNGGGARSLAYRQVLADALGRPVVRRAAPEATARGACVQAVAVLEGATVAGTAERWRPFTLDAVPPRTDPATIDAAHYDLLATVADRPRPSAT